MAGRKSDFTLPTNTLDDLFSTQEERDDAKLSKIRDIPLELIDDFPDHPFKVRDDEDMIQLVESVKERGVITPATVRQKEDGRYELISGHRRKRACELAGFEALRCEVVDLDRDAATVLMVESNYQRSQILPSEKAFAYKMRLEAMKRQAGRPSKENSVPVAQNYEGKTSRELLGEQVGESQDQVRRYIRLTNLVPELLDLVDEGKIKMRPAVELSYLDEESQRAVVDEIDLNQCTPSHDQTIRMRKFFTDGKLTPEVVSAIITVSHLTVDEMADLYGFDAEQREYLAELLKDENNSIWAAVLYGIRYSDDQIVTVALSQVGNVGGEPYWSWYGFGSRVEWCACFVSWCADQCGYIETGVCPKFAGCENGVQWFRERGQWIDGSVEPVPGMIIFFDWDNKGGSGSQDGAADHAGIVQKVENGIIYAVEGNSGNLCRVNRYPVGQYEIMGYGILRP